MLHTTVLVHMGYNGPLREVSTNATNIQSVWFGLDSSRVLYLLATMVHTIDGWSISSIAQALRKSEFSISRHLNDYLEKEKKLPFLTL